jgi:hypothetical protein
MDAQAVLQELLELAQRGIPSREDQVIISGQEPVLPTNGYCVPFHSIVEGWE